MDVRCRVSVRTLVRGLRPKRAALVTVALVAGLAIVTACGSSSKVLRVTVSADSSEDFAAYLQCMRAHGVAVLPAPGSRGQPHTSVQSSGGLDPSSPAFKAADSACRSLNPVYNLSPAQRAQLKAANLAYAQCMRQHGIPDFPDPNADGALQFPIPPPSDLDTSSPAFQTAQQACKPLLPARVGGPDGATATSTDGNGP